MPWKKEKVKILKGEGSVWGEIECPVLGGLLAVHPSLRSGPEDILRLDKSRYTPRYTLTHVPTGREVWRGKYTQVRKVAAALLMDGGDGASARAWGFKTKKEFDANREELSKRRLRAIESVVLK